jgi:hypothetical protein
MCSFICRVEYSMHIMVYMYAQYIYIYISWKLIHSKHVVHIYIFRLSENNDKKET